MTFHFTDARVDQSNGIWLCLKVKEPSSAIGFAMDKKPVEYVAEISERKKRRSLDANAYYWKLCGMLAGKTGYDPEHIYLHHIKEIGNYKVICMQEEAVEEFEKMWKSKHLGRFIETRKSKIPGCVTVLAYYGSSDFSRSEMSVLIDNCIQDCESVGIETMTPDELSALKSMWGDDDIE